LRDDRAGAALQETWRGSTLAVRSKGGNSARDRSAVWRIGVAYLQINGRWARKSAVCRLHGNGAGFDLRKRRRSIRIIGARLGDNEIGDVAINRHELPFAHASARAANVAGCGRVGVVANLLGRLKFFGAHRGQSGRDRVNHLAACRGEEAHRTRGRRASREIVAQARFFLN